MGTVASVRDSGLPATLATTSPTFAPVALHEPEAITNATCPWSALGPNRGVLAGAWFLPGDPGQERPAGTVAIGSTVCFVCPNVQRSEFP